MSIATLFCILILNALRLIHHCVISNSLQIPITLKKEEVVDNSGYAVKKCGFKIGGGIDQNYMKSPQGYSDNVSSSTLNPILPL